MPAPHRILFCAADPSPAGRSRWEAEYRDARQALKLAHHRDAFVMQDEWAVNPSALQRALLSQEPLILHLCGNSQDGGIVLEGRGGQPHPVPPAVMANLLALFQDQVRWVLLSGCFDPAQASAISEEIEQVIGLGAGLRPEHRIAAATSIYDAIGAGKEDPRFIVGLARNMLMMEGADPEQVHLYQRGAAVDLSQGPSERPAAAAATEAPRSEYVSHDEAYRCDRVPQTGVFREAWERRDQPFHFFLVHGPDPQSHGGLVKRFYQQYLRDRDLPQTTPYHKLVLNQAYSEAAYRDALRAKLLEALDLTKLLKLPDEQEMAAVFQRLARRQVESVAIDIRVRSSYWKPFTPQLFDWFINTYCQVAEPDPFGPSFYFFLSIIYETEADHLVLVDQIRAELPKLSPCLLLEELRPVTKADILDWIEAHLSSNPIRRDRLWTRYFPENRPTYDMAEVELRLDGMIDKEPID